MIDKSEICAIIMTAFLPLQCVAELQNYEHALGFRIYLPDGKFLTHKEPNASTLLHKTQLASLIQLYRDKLTQLGIQLHAWVPPNASEP